MREQLRAGIAVHNEGYYHAAHDAWEDHWLDLESGTPDERLLHGLIQFTAAVYHATNRNWEGAVKLSELAPEYLEGLPSPCRGVDLEPVLSYLDALADDPELIERAPPIRVAHEGRRLGFSDLDAAEAGIAAVVLAEEFGYDDGPIERARSFAGADLEAGRDDSRFIALLYDFLETEESRDVVYRRLVEHVERRTAKEDDVSGLFE